MQSLGTSALGWKGKFRESGYPGSRTLHFSAFGVFVLRLLGEWDSRLEGCGECQSVLKACVWPLKDFEKRSGWRGPESAS